MVWMPKSLKEELRDGLTRRGEELGYPGLVDMICDETIATDEAGVMEHLQKVGHPVLGLDSLVG